MLTAVNQYRSGKRLIAASEWPGIRDDSDVSFAGSTSGTDCADALIAYFSYLSTSKSIGYFDVQTATSKAIPIYSNTKIIGKNDCGIIRKSGTRRPIFINSSRSHVSGTYTNSNIYFENLIINGNCYGLSDGTSKLDSGTEYGALNGQVWLQDIWFSGVDGIRFVNTKHFNSRNFATIMSNSRNIRLINTVIDQGDAFVEPNHDGHHFTGPVSDVIVTGVNVRSFDDAVAFNADEGIGAVAHPVLGGIAYGPIISVKVLNTTLNNGPRGGGYGWKGVRFLSTTTSSPIDQVYVEGIHGGTTGTVLVADNVPGVDAGPGAYGSFIVKNVDCDFYINAGAGGADRDAYITFSAKFRNIIIENIRRRESDNYNVATILLGDFLDCPSVTIRDYKWTDNVTTSGPHIQCYGKIGTLRLIDISNERDPVLGSGAHLFQLLPVSSLLGIDRLELNNIRLNSYTLGVYHASGYLGELTADNVSMEYDGGGGLYHNTSTHLPVYSAGACINVVNLVSPTGTGTIGTKIGPGWDGSGNTAGSKYVTGRTTADRVWDATSGKFSDTACSTAQTTDAGAIKGWSDRATGRGAGLTRASTNPILKTSIIGSNSVIRFAAGTYLDYPQRFLSLPFGVIILAVPRSVAAGQVWLGNSTVIFDRGWILGQPASDPTKLEFYVARAGGSNVDLLSSTGIVASGTPIIVAATYDPLTGNAALYKWTSGTTFTSITTATLSGGVPDLTGINSYVGRDASGVYPATTDIGYLAYFNYAPDVTRLNTELGILKTLKGL